jgi:hypothetical protein
MPAPQRQQHPEENLVLPDKVVPKRGPNMHCHERKEQPESIRVHVPGKFPHAFVIGRLEQARDPLEAEDLQRRRMWTCMM